jgi:hypothetical protein
MQSRPRHPQEGAQTRQNLPDSAIAEPDLVGSEPVSAISCHCLPSPGDSPGRGGESRNGSAPTRSGGFFRQMHHGGGNPLRKSTCGENAPSNFTTPASAGGGNDDRPARTAPSVAEVARLPRRHLRPREPGGFRQGVAVARPVPRTTTTKFSKSTTIHPPS